VAALAEPPGQQQREPVAGDEQPVEHRDGRVTSGEVVRRSSSRSAAASVCCGIRASMLDRVSVSLSTMTVIVNSSSGIDRNVIARADLPHVRPRQHPDDDDSQAALASVNCRWASATS
jgi:hypothetical protein